MIEGIRESDLPSIKFELEIKNLMNYKIFESFVKNETIDEEINNWIQSFQTKVEMYLMKLSENPSFDHDKRCKHFNYLINVTISKISSLSDNMFKTSDWSNKIKEWRKKLFSSNPSLKCNISNIYDSKKKILSTFCEDSDFIKSKLNDIQNSIHCNSILNNMSTRKDELISVHKRYMRGNGFIIIDNNCSTQYLDTIFTSFTCNYSVDHVSESDSFSPSGKHGGGEKLGKVLMTQPLPSSGSLDNERKGPIKALGESETHNSSSSNYIGLVSLPILGISVLSFLLYKYTPLGSKIYSRFQNKDIPINEDYEAKDQMLFNISNSNDIYSENMKYNISYQTLQS
ncbi:PIR protein [Plasmodium ovale]|uniref:PIR Superfamily Protein n=2 Tax=Plasmodium ovale TaxID=36330 RepID=A0A1A8X3P3_PLAOA|nr:PIR Superfamily Protein [Plasmodium ovale curtisi]SBT83201.1 PIR protein [Plasmodium ovale]